jgi:hypothetical protein
MAARGHMTTSLNKISQKLFSHSWSCYGSEKSIIPFEFVTAWIKTLVNFLKNVPALWLPEDAALKGLRIKNREKLF